jgi:hypothetical protein
VRSVLQLDRPDGAGWHFVFKQRVSSTRQGSAYGLTVGRSVEENSQQADRDEGDPADDHRWKRNSSEHGYSRSIAIRK